MSIRLSTGLKNKLINLFSANQNAIFGSFYIDIMSGQRPTSADSAHTETKLLTLSVNGDGTVLTFEASPTDGVLEKGSGTWKGTGLAVGTASWFRLYKSGDTPGSLSTTAERIDGTVGTSNADLVLSSTSITVGAPVTVSAAQFTLPSE